jgi:hypothetical protein
MVVAAPDVVTPVDGHWMAASSRNEVLSLFGCFDFWRGFFADSRDESGGEFVAAIAARPDRQNVRARKTMRARYMATASQHVEAAQLAPNNRRTLLKPTRQSNRPGKWPCHEGKLCSGDPAPRFRTPFAIIEHARAIFLLMN